MGAACGGLRGVTDVVQGMGVLKIRMSREGTEGAHRGLRHMKYTENSD